MTEFLKDIETGCANHETEVARPSVWVFQGNPDRYRLTDALSAETQEYWNLRQHAKRIRKGDIVLIWISGEDAGIYAVGTIVSEPVVRPDSATGVTYWKPSSEGERPMPRVLVRYDTLLLTNPLGKAFLSTDPDLCNLSILRNPRGTNFSVTPEEWVALQGWLNALPF